MKKELISLTVSAALALSLCGCGSTPSGEIETPAEEPAVTEDVQNTPTEAVEAPDTAPNDSSEPVTETGRQDGERFEEVIILEGMEETVNYEHIRNDTLGIEMDYEYESFVRQSGQNSERFVSVWDDAENPENYLEIRYSPKDADSVAASVSERLSEKYELINEPYALDRAGDCIMIEASEVKGGGYMPDSLQTVYIIPASDGCRVATAHCSIEAAEGFGRRFAYMMQTLSVIDRTGASELSDEQALNAVRNYCITGNPELEESEDYPVYWEISSSDGREIVVLFRSYTCSLTYYHIDRSTGDTYVTEFVPGITEEEQKTDETLNVWDYVD